MQILIVQVFIINFWFYQNETSSISVRNYNLFNFFKLKKQRNSAVDRSVWTINYNGIFVIIQFIDQELNGKEQGRARNLLDLIITKRLLEKFFNEELDLVHKDKTEIGKNNFMSVKTRVLTSQSYVTIVKIICQSIPKRIKQLVSS